MSSSSTSNPTDQFGPNEWLVEEMYQRFLEDPDSVDPAWHEFFADYRPGDASPTSGNAAQTAADTTAAPSPLTPIEKPGRQAVRREPAADSDAAEPEDAEPAPERRTESAVADGNGAAAKPAAGTTSQAAARPAEKTPEHAEGVATTLRGAASLVVKNMNASLTVPTATSVRAVPAKLLADNRVVINNQLRRTRGGKISFTHMIGYAVVKALAEFPVMNRHFAEVDGKPTVVQPEHVNLGLAIDLPGKSKGQRTLVVVSIKGCESLSFAQFWSAYEDIVRKARSGNLTAEDFKGTTISLTNPGTLGTNHSVPRLMQGQGTIVGVGAMEYPAEFQGASQETLSKIGISKIITLTSTYDHRVIQGAESGDFLRRVHALLLGEDGFYDDIFGSLRVPYEPVRWVQDLPDDPVDKVARVIEMIDAYRTRGHLMADTDPLNYRQRRHPDLDVLSHGLTLWDLDREFAVGGFAGHERMKLRDVLGVLRNSYCRTIGVEYMHISEPEQRAWLQERIEVPHQKPHPNEQKYILSKLNAAEAFETFLQTKYVGQKRFSLEGGETVIPLLDAVLDKAAEHEMDEVVIGMPHRGRLNVLANIVGKPISQIFREFEGNLDPGQAHGSGDVKYHLGAEGKYFRMFGDGETVVSLASNPSHLEAVDPVLEGIVRAKQDLLDKGHDRGYTVLPLMLHGDAAFAGQGVVAETLNLALLRGYRTGGTVHVVVNNQVGFTTAPENSRSSTYSTDVAKMIDAPVFHVNGDDPEACVWVAKLAVEYRERWHNDVVIDMVCYRRRGHNEGDDPSMTQPAMYDLVDAKRSVRKLYTESLIGRGDISMEDAEHALRDFSNQLEHVFNEVRELERTPPRASPSVEDEQRQPPDLDTSVPLEVIHRIGDAHVELPEGFTVAPAREARAAEALQDVPRRRRGLGVRRADRARVDADGRQARAAVGPGHPARHVRPAALGGDRPQDRRGVLPAAQPVRRAGPVPALRLGALGVRRGRLRVRLLGGQPGRVRRLGGPVRRLRQRRPVDHRRVHLVRRGQVGPDLRRGAAAPARPRRPGPRPQLRPHRAVPAAVRGGVDDGLRAVRARQLLPPAARPRDGRGAPPAGGVHAEVDAARQAGGQPAGRLHRRPVPPRDRRPAVPGGRHPRQPRCGRCSCAAGSSTGRWRRRSRSAASPTSRWCGWSSSTRCPTAGSPPCSTATRTPRTSGGCRRSRATRGRGRSWVWSCRRSCRGWSG